jgi:hypothetical protein
MFCDALFVAQAFEHDGDLLLGAILTEHGAADILKSAQRTRSPDSRKAITPT